MPCREVHVPSKKSASRSDKLSATALGVSAQPIGLYISAVATTQIAFLEFMSQCTLAWINASTGHSATSAPENEDVQEAVQPRMRAKRGNRAVMISGSEWLSMPVITGIEETLSDQFIKPRPVGTQESEVLALWERSNEFEPLHLVDSTQLVDGHRDSA